MWGQMRGQGEDGLEMLSTRVQLGRQQDQAWGFATAATLPGFRGSLILGDILGLKNFLKTSWGLVEECRDEKLLGAQVLQAPPPVSS